MLALRCNPSRGLSQIVRLGDLNNDWVALYWLALHKAKPDVQMSKKNNQGTRRKQHSFDLAKEAEARKKSEKKSKAAAQKLSVKPQAVKPKKKTKGVRIKKNVVVAVRSLSLTCLRALPVIHMPDGATPNASCIHVRGAHTTHGLAPTRCCSAPCHLQAA